MTSIAIPRRCPHCHAELDAVGVRRMGGLEFCGGCRRSVGKTATVAPGSVAQTDDPRQVKPL